MQRHGPEIFDGHPRCCCDDLVEFVQLAHRIIENGGDDSPVAVTRRAGVALAEPEMANEVAMFWFQREFQMHPVRIIFSTREAEVLLERMGFCPVSDC